MIVKGNERSALCLRLLDDHVMLAQTRHSNATMLSAVQHSETNSQEIEPTEGRELTYIFNAVDFRSTTFYKVCITYNRTAEKLE
ncbi:hypothetical protein LSAT2_018873 [Lamellibrachia satsuma]|nr:hypothetical protein LSAT2_018873 [Lamellibrachia satsuma]